VFNPGAFMTRARAAHDSGVLFRQGDPSAGNALLGSELTTCTGTSRVQSWISQFHYSLALHFEPEMFMF